MQKDNRLTSRSMMYRGSPSVRNMQSLFADWTSFYKVPDFSSSFAWSTESAGLDYPDYPGNMNSYQKYERSFGVYPDLYCPQNLCDQEWKQVEYSDNNKQKNQYSQWYDCDAMKTYRKNRAYTRYRKNQTLERKVRNETEINDLNKFYLNNNILLDVFDMKNPWYVYFYSYFRTCSDFSGSLQYPYKGNITLWPSNPFTKNLTKSINVGLNSRGFGYREAFKYANFSEEKLNKGFDYNSCYNPGCDFSTCGFANVSMAPGEIKDLEQLRKYALLPSMAVHAYYNLYIVITDFIEEYVDEDGDDDKGETVVVPYSVLSNRYSLDTVSGRLGLLANLNYTIYRISNSIEREYTSEYTFQPNGLVDFQPLISVNGNLDKGTSTKLSSFGMGIVGVHKFQCNTLPTEMPFVFLGTASKFVRVGVMKLQQDYKNEIINSNPNSVGNLTLVDKISNAVHHSGVISALTVTSKCQDTSSTVLDIIFGIFLLAKKDSSTGTKYGTSWACEFYSSVLLSSVLFLLAAPVPLVVYNISSDRNYRRVDNSEGVTKTVFDLSSIIVVASYLFWPFFLFALFSVFPDIFPNAETSLVFVLLLLFYIAMISLTLVLTTVCPSTYYSWLWSTAFYLICFTPVIFVHSRGLDTFASFSRSTTFVWCLSPVNAFFMADYIIFLFSSRGQVLTWEDMNQNGSLDFDFTMSDCFIMLAVDAVMYYIVWWYINTLFHTPVPSRASGRFPVYFPVSPSFWTGKFERLERKEDNLFEGHIHGNEEGFTHRDYGKCSTGDSNTSGGESEDLNSRGVERQRSTLFCEREPRHLFPIVQLKNVRKVYGENVVLNNLNLNFYEGQITCLLGQNGAGKTTLMEIIRQRIPMTSGDALVNGFLLSLIDNRLIQGSVGFVPQADVIFEDLTVEDHIAVYLTLSGQKLTEDMFSFDESGGNDDGEDSDKSSDLHTVGGILNSLHLLGSRTKKASKLSGGMKRRLMLAICIAMDPAIYILDEPTAGVDPISRRLIWNLFKRECKERNKTIIFSTHFMEEADMYADRIFVLNKGSVLCSGSPFFLRQKFGSGLELRVCQGELFDAVISVEHIAKELCGIFDGFGFFDRSASANAKGVSGDELEISKLVETRKHIEMLNDSQFFLISIPAHTAPCLPSILNVLEGLKSANVVASFTVSYSSMTDAYMNLHSSLLGKSGELLQEDLSKLNNSKVFASKGSSSFGRLLKAIVLHRLRTVWRDANFYILCIVLPILVSLMGFLIFFNYAQESFPDTCYQTSGDSDLQEAVERLFPPARKVQLDARFYGAVKNIYFVNDQCPVDDADCISFIGALSKELTEGKQNRIVVYQRWNDFYSGCIEAVLKHPNSVLLGCINIAYYSVDGKAVNDRFNISSVSAPYPALYSMLSINSIVDYVASKVNSAVLNMHVVNKTELYKSSSILQTFAITKRLPSVIPSGPSNPVIFPFSQDNMIVTFGLVVFLALLLPLVYSMLSLSSTEMRDLRKQTFVHSGRLAYWACMFIWDLSIFMFQIVFVVIFLYTLGSIGNNGEDVNGSNSVYAFLLLCFGVAFSIIPFFYFFVNIGDFHVVNCVVAFSIVFFTSFLIFSTNIDNGVLYFPRTIDIEDQGNYKYVPVQVGELECSGLQVRFNGYCESSGKYYGSAVFPGFSFTAGVVKVAENWYAFRHNQYVRANGMKVDPNEPETFEKIPAVSNSGSTISASCFMLMPFENSMAYEEAGYFIMMLYVVGAFLWLMFFASQTWVCLKTFNTILKFLCIGGVWTSRSLYRLLYGDGKPISDTSQITARIIYVRNYVQTSLYYWGHAYEAETFDEDMSVTKERQNVQASVSRLNDQSADECGELTGSDSIAIEPNSVNVNLRIFKNANDSISSSSRRNTDVGEAFGLEENNPIRCSSAECNDASNPAGVIFDGVSKFYSGVPVVDSASFTVPSGGVTGVVGLNGAGKSSLISQLVRFLRIDEGDIYACGHNIKKTWYDKYPVTLGFSPQLSLDSKRLSVWATVSYHADIMFGCDRECLEIYLKQMLHVFGLDGFEDFQVRYLSGGMQKRLSNLISVLGTPRILVLDEPSTGLDPIARMRFWNLLQELYVVKVDGVDRSLEDLSGLSSQKLSRSKSVILTSHSMEETEMFCDKIAFLAFGKVRALGSVPYLKERFSRGVSVFIKLKANELETVEPATVEAGRECEFREGGSSHEKDKRPGFAPDESSSGTSGNQTFITEKMRMKTERLNKNESKPIDMLVEYFQIHMDTELGFNIVTDEKRMIAVLHCPCKVICVSKLVSLLETSQIRFPDLVKYYQIQEPSLDTVFSVVNKDRTKTYAGDFRFDELNKTENAGAEDDNPFLDDSMFEYKEFLIESGLMKAEDS
eukprot:Nk52_evm12s1524 gene=Nk52_evmTU12s1524